MDQSLKNMLKSVKENESSISMILGGLVVIVVGLLLFSYFKNDNTPSVSLDGEATEAATIGQKLVEEDGKLVPVGLPTEHTVKQGETLWAVAETYFSSGYNWVDIAEANKMKAPYLLTEGMKLSVPKAPVIQAKNSPKAPVQVATSNKITDTSYTVKAGDDLWNIAVRAYGDGYQWSKIWEANKKLITNPGHIEVNWQLTIPR